MTRAIADNDGVRIAHEVIGDDDAPSVVLVHGLGYAGASGGWGPLPSLLADHLRVVTLDNRGIGGSDAPPGPYTAALMADDVVAVMDAVGLERTHVVGSSLGGMIAQELAVDHASRVDRLVLLSTTPGGDDAVPMPAQTVELIEAMPSMAPADALAAAVRNALAPAYATDERGLVARLVEHRLSVPRPPAGWAAQAHAGTTYDGGDRLGAVEAPTLVLHGDQDVVVAPGNARLLAARIPDAELSWLEGHGHLPFWEDAVLVAARLVTFLTI